jgi:bifunctional DNA-binding transcriptional regulator/antitoxin component of YhaV-PrlF toxin-antitoxin module
MTNTVAKMSDAGRLTIPAAFREAAGLPRGGSVVLEVVDGELRLRSLARAMERARALTRELVAGKDGLSVDAFLANRRREAGRET